MTIQTTIIPQKIDLSKSVDGSNIDYINKKLTFGKEALDSLGLLELTATLLESSSAINASTDKIYDIFTQNTGLLNSVDTSGTTSVFEELGNYYRNYTQPKIYVYGSGAKSQSTKISFRAKQDFLFLSFKWNCNLGNFTNTTAQINIFKNGVIQETIPNTQYYTNTYYINTLTKPISVNNNDYIEITATFNGNSAYIFNHTASSSVNNYIENYDGNNLISGNYIYIQLPPTQPTDKVIKINYNISKPNSFYCSLYSSATESNEIGDVDIEFYDVNDTLLGTYQPFTINETLNFSVTPNYILLRQKATELSKISKYIFLIE